MRKAPSLKQIKRVPKVIFALIITFFLMNLFLCYATIDHNVSIDSALKYGGEKTIAKVDVYGNNFITGTNGRVNWTVINFKEAILINLTNTNNLFSFYDLFYLLVINCVLFLSVNKMNEDTVFSVKTIRGFEIILYLIVFYPLFDFSTNIMSKFILEKLTNNVLTVPLHAFGYFKVLIGLSFVRLIPLVIRKGESLQKEQDLTI